MGYGHIVKRFRLAKAISLGLKEGERQVIAIQSLSGIAQGAMSQTKKIVSPGFTRAIAY
jgi:hypothetical protein